MVCVSVALVVGVVVLEVVTDDVSVVLGEVTRVKVSVVALGVVEKVVLP